MMIKYVVVLCCVVAALAKAANSDKEVTDPEENTYKEIAQELFDCVFETDTCTDRGHTIEDPVKRIIENTCESCSEEVKELSVQFIAVGFKLLVAASSDTAPGDEARSIAAGSV